MKTIIEYLEMMDEPERSQAIENAENMPLLADREPESIKTAIGYAFSWVDTIQGFDYWFSIQDKYWNR